MVSTVGASTSEVITTDVTTPESTSIKETTTSGLLTTETATPAETSAVLTTDTVSSTSVLTTLESTFTTTLAHSITSEGSTDSNSIPTTSALDQTSESLTSSILYMRFRGDFTLTELNGDPVVYSVSLEDSSSDSYQALAVPIANVVSIIFILRYCTHAEFFYPLTGYEGLIKISTAVATASYLMRVLCSNCGTSYGAFSSYSVLQSTINGI